MNPTATRQADTAALSKADCGIHPEVTLIVVSFNTRELLRQSLQQMLQACSGLAAEVIVVDNASHDGSADMVAAEFPQIRLMRARHNLGFAAANNLGRTIACGEFLVLVNPDAFIGAEALAHGLARMRAEKDVALAGGLLLGRDGKPEPSARMFPSLLHEFFSISGLAARFPRSKLLGGFDRTWADPTQDAEVDWVPGAFCIIRQRALEQVGFFDERFFLYYEEVDLCRRLRSAGWSIRYWPRMCATHFGGESSKTVTTQSVSNHGRQLTLWRMRSALLYYRKHHGRLAAWASAQLEILWHRLRSLKNRHNPRKSCESLAVIEAMQQAWQQTLGGRVSPPRPW
jgi:GT2 family glycosyltransferase